MKDPNQLVPEILFHVEDTVKRYKGRNTNYKLINEPTHGDQFRTNYDDIWNLVLQKARESDPDVELMINDYDIARADMGQCLLDLVDGYDIDYLGVQASFQKTKETICSVYSQNPE